MSMSPDAIDPQGEELFFPIYCGFCHYFRTCWSAVAPGKLLLGSSCVAHVADDDGTGTWACAHQSVPPRTSPSASACSCARPRSHARSLAAGPHALILHPSSSGRSGCRCQAVRTCCSSWLQVSRPSHPLLPPPLLRAPSLRSPPAPPPAAALSTTSCVPLVHLFATCSRARGAAEQPDGAGDSAHVVRHHR